MKVKLICVKPKNHIFPILSWLIRFFQKTNYSHQAIMVGDVVIDATGKDSRINYSKEFFERYELMEEVEVKVNANFNQVVNWSLPHLNKSYAFFQLIGMMLILMGIIKNNPFGKDEKSLICCEFLLLFIRDFKGYPIDDSDNYDLVEVWDIAKEVGENHDNAS